ncbi:trithorax group protein osa-like [Lingula anatina]|uniref:Trithorax group protein osa-like n=1 Tax=Lingula anatina TaxID=7574 RepID=A0A1S3ITE3_LINAN|nr:trithorax group protein osa-like [Lingula anatina]XP_013401481.1 trithorax group protein osa-like [Lingula anatina]|eukprot:XP_013401480.1 trithorax group protein osa-like [Lingula anatina]
MRMSEKTSDQSQIKGGSSPSHGSSEQLAKDPQVNGHESAKEDGDKDLKGNVKETPQGNVHDGQGDWQDKMNEAESGQKVPRGNGAGDSHSNGDPAGLDGADSKVSSACLDHGESPTKTKAVKENVVSHGKASATKGLSNGNSGKTGKSSSEKSLPLEVSTPVEPGFSLETSPRSHRNRHREGRGEGTQKVHSPRGYPPHPPHAQGPQHTHPPAQGPQAPPHQTPPHHHQSDPSASPRGGHSPSGHSPRSTSRGGSPQRENGATGTMSTGAPVPPSSSGAMAGGTGTVPAGTSLSSGSGQQGLTLGPGQHVVHVHVNPGETFSVRVGDQIQHIQGPATVRMVSQNGPPMPMPMQVPPGHIVQQIVDENGILTHVILSPQPPPGMTPAPSISSVGYYVSIAISFFFSRRPSKMLACSNPSDVEVV